MNLPVGMISAFAGWFIREGESLALVASDEDQLEAAMTHLVRIALDGIAGGYVGVVPAAAQGKAMQTIPMIGTEEVERRLASAGEDWTLRDVRDADERRSEEPTSELQSLMRSSYAVLCLNNKKMLRPVDHTRIRYQTCD